MPHHVPSVQGEAPNVNPADRIAQLEAKLAAFPEEFRKVQKLMGRMQSVENRLAALEAKAPENHHAEVNPQAHTGHGHDKK